VAFSKAPPYKVQILLKVRKERSVFAMLSRIPSSTIRRIPVLALAIVLSGCATKPPASDPAAVAAFAESNDQLEPFNRAMFKVDQGIDAVLTRPIVSTYRSIIPDPARRGMKCGRARMRDLSSVGRLEEQFVAAEPNEIWRSVIALTEENFRPCIGRVDSRSTLTIPTKCRR